MNRIAPTSPLAPAPCGSPRRHGVLSSFCASIYNFASMGSASLTCNSPNAQTMEARERPLSRSRAVSRDLIEAGSPMAPMARAGIGAQHAILTLQGRIERGQHLLPRGFEDGLRKTHLSVSVFGIIHRQQQRYGRWLRAQCGAECREDLGAVILIRRRWVLQQQAEYLRGGVRRQHGIEAIGVSEDYRAKNRRQRGTTYAFFE